MIVDVDLRTNAVTWGPEFAPEGVSPMTLKLRKRLHADKQFVVPMEEMNVAGSGASSWRAKAVEAAREAASRSGRRRLVDGTFTSRQQKLLQALCAIEYVPAKDGPTDLVQDSNDDAAVPTPELIQTASVEDSFAILMTQEFNTNALLVEAALIRLANLCGSHKPPRKNFVPLILGNGMEAIVRALEAHGAQEGVQVAGCSLLYRLSNCEARKQEVAKYGALGAVASSLDKHPTSRRVAKSGGLAILKLVHDSAIRTNLAITLRLPETLDKVSEGLSSKDATPKKLLCIELAQRWLQVHADMLAASRSLRA